MGIKTRFNPMGGGSKEKGKLSDWRYSTAANGQITLYEYLGTYSATKPVYVPRKGGKTIINRYTLGTATDTPFYNNPSVVSVDLQSVPWVSNSMYSAFYNCQNLTSVKGINQNVTSMASTFSYCNNLNQNIQIPNSVTNMSSTFYGCSNLNQNIQIPNSVTNIESTFYQCYNLNQNIQIPNSVTDMAMTFVACTNLNQNIQIPNSVTSMGAAFRGCSNLNQNIQIPNSVTSMGSTFYSCYNLNQNIQIPNSVTSMSSTFSLCNNLSSWINICTTEISSAASCFNDTAEPNVFIIADYINGTHTKTYNAFNSAGWKWSDGQLVGGTGNKVRCWSVGWSNYHCNFSTMSGYCTVDKWNGTLDTFLNNNVPYTNPVVPSVFNELGANYSVAIQKNCFSKNTVIASIDFGAQIPWVSNTMGTGTNSSNRNAVCLNCFNLVSAQGVINNSVTDISAVFDRCYNLTDVRVVWPDSVTKAYVTYEMINATDVPPFGEGITNMQSCFFSANSLINYPVIPPKVTAFATPFTNGCSNSARGNIFILSPGLTGNAAVAGNYFRGYNASYRRNIYAYFNYSNGTTTATRTRFASNGIYKATSGNAAGTNPMYNSTSNFYVYDLTSVFGQIWTQTSGTTSTTLLKYNTVQPIPHIAVFAQYPDYNVVSIGNNCFNGATNLQTIALYGRPFNSTDLSNAFNGCRYLKVIQGLNLEGVINMSNTFYGCLDLNQNIQIPEGVINMDSTFNGCLDLNQNIQIPNSVTNMYQTFQYCTNLNQNIQIPSSVTNVANTFFDCYSLNNVRINILSENISSAINCFQASGTNIKNVYIPYKYSNGVNTQTFNSFVTAGYLTSAGVSTGINGVTMHDLNE